jgi:vanillate/4-hydroxybenzoate decarboxylase subunit D
MSATTQGTAPLMCPRCRSITAEVRSLSPNPGVWTVYGCNTCFYTWRSTEAEENTNQDKYPEVFRLSPEDLPKLQVAPSIPPLQQTKP